MKYILSLIIPVLAVVTADAQILQWSPLFATVNDTITVTYDATQGNRGLVGETEVYAHTGVLTKESVASWDWKHVKTAWGENTPETKMTPLGDDKWRIRFHIKTYYGLADHEKATHLAFVFRNAAGTREGKTETGGDIFLPIYEQGLNVTVLSPQQTPTFLEIGDSLNIVAISSGAIKMNLYLNDRLVVNTTADTLRHLLSAENPGKIDVHIDAVDSTGAVKSATFYVVVNAPLSTEPLPDGVRCGVNELSATSVVLALQAPHKNFVYLIGDWNDWEAEPQFYLKRTPDGETWWIRLDELTPGAIYRYQYWVDGKLKIADPYAELVLDPDNDQYIDESTYPNMPQYPVGKTEEIVSVLQTAQPDFHWSGDFDRPAAEDLVIYELLLRDFIKEHDYTTLIDSLDYLAALGVNAIELMPISEFEGNLSWGYNPSFYFAPDKYYGPKHQLQRFIDEAHKRGIAVIQDMVLNHTYGQSPMVRLYLDDMSQNPWYNETSPNPTFSWGYDFNHQSPATQQFVDRVTSHWLTRYRMDGFRFDFTKGFTNTPGDGWARDESRIEILKRMADHIRAVSPGAYVILEHFTENSEEQELADYGMLIWGNSNYNYNEATMGYHDGGKSDFSWGVYKKRGWSSPHLVTYMESHDEERLMYKNKRWGNSSGSYDVKDEKTALERMELAAAFFFPIPGPKMIWQFGELGYDYSIDYNGRTGEKPIRWDYLGDVRRKKLHDIFADLIALKKGHKAFSSSDFEFSFAEPFKWLRVNDDSMNVVIVGNFDVQAQGKTISFQHTGTWTDFFSGETLIIESQQKHIDLAPGEYHIFTDAGIITGVKEKPVQPSVYELRQNYPNPFNPATTISFALAAPGEATLEIFNIAGQKVRTLWHGRKTAGQHRVEWNGLDDRGRPVSSGVYVYRLTAGKHVLVKKMALAR